jgi:hypothetical protein
MTDTARSRIRAGPGGGLELATDHAARTDMSSLQQIEKVLWVVEVLEQRSTSCTGTGRCGALLHLALGALRPNDELLIVEVGARAGHRSVAVEDGLLLRTVALLRVRN